MGKAVVVKGKAKVWDQTQKPDTPLWEQLGMSFNKGRKAADSAEKSWYEELGMSVKKAYEDWKKD
jgi:hypothetical protein